MNIVDEVRALTRGYSRTGSKDNRDLQRNRMLAFARFCRDKGARNLSEVGQRHVIQYWKSTEHLANSTRYHHHLALFILWDLAGKPGKPPEPRERSEQLATCQSR